MTLATLLLLASIQEASPAPPPAPAAAAVRVGTIDKGLALLKSGRYTAARNVLEAVVAAEPESAAAHFYLGYALYKIAEPTRRLTPEKQKAAEHFAKSVALDPAFRPAF